MALLGSWHFIMIQTCLVALWIAANMWLLRRPFDPWPFILLNLAFSTQAAYASPLILMASNRQAHRDRARDDHEADEVDVLVQMLSVNTALTQDVHQLTAEIHVHTRDHAEILTVLRDVRDALSRPVPPAPPAP